MKFYKRTVCLGGEMHIKIWNSRDEKAVIFPDNDAGRQAYGIFQNGLRQGGHGLYSLDDPKCIMEEDDRHEGGSDG